MTEQEEANTELFPSVWLLYHGVPMPCIRHDVAPYWRMDYCHKGQCTVRAAEQYTRVLCSGGILLSRMDCLPHMEGKCSQLYEGFSLLLSLSRLEQAIAETKVFLRVTITGSPDCFRNKKYPFSRSCLREKGYFSIRWIKMGLFQKVFHGP